MNIRKPPTGPASQAPPVMIKKQDRGHSGGNWNDGFAVATHEIP